MLRINKSTEGSVLGRQGIYNTLARTIAQMLIEVKRSITSALLCKYLVSGSLLLFVQYVIQFSYPGSKLSGS
jgi:hypothetical protein